MKLTGIILSAIVCFMVTNQSFSQSKKKDGDYYAKVFTYDRAVKSYERELKDKPDDQKLLLKIVDCYLKSNLDRSLALPYIEKALEQERNVENVLRFAKVLFYGMYLDEASMEFDWVKMHTDKESKEFKEADIFLKWLLNAQAYINTPLNISLLNLGKGINTDKSELNPYVTADESVLVFSSNKRYHSNIGANYYNISVALREDNDWSGGKRINSDINSPYDEIVAGYSPEGSDLFVFHNREGIEKVGYSKYEGKANFEPLKDLEYPLDRKGGEYGVWLTESKDTLFYVTENESNQTDIYYSIKLPEGYYGEPRPVVGEINSSYDENFPVLVKSGKRMYFSSNGENSMGGYDLFYSDWDEVKKQWGKPVNLGYPINDMYDNFTIAFTNSNRYAYISSIRREGLGERDIYKVVFKDKNPENLILKCRVTQETDTGKIVPLEELRIELKKDSEEEIVGKYRCSSDSAKFIMALTPGKYIVSAKGENGLIKSWPLEIPEIWYSHIPSAREFVIPKKKEE